MPNRTRLLFAVLALTVVLAPLADAHAVRSSSDPGPGDRLDMAPTAIRITFTEPTDPQGTTLRVVNAVGDRVDLGDATSTGGDRPTWTLSLQPDLPEGAYRILWQTLSTADGHVENGVVGFAIGDAIPPASNDGSGTTLSFLPVVARSLAYAGIALVLGAAVFLVAMNGVAGVPRPAVLRWLRLGAIVHVAGVALLLAITRDQAGLSAAAFAASATGRAFLLRLGLGAAALVFAVLAASPRVPARSPPFVAVLAVIASALAGARFGHASLAGLPGIAVDAIHLLAATLWVGALAVFLFLLAGPAKTWSPDVVQRVGIRFGTVALMAVLGLLAAGFATTISIQGAPTPGVLRETSASPWGRILFAKLGLTAVMLLVAAVNRYVLLSPPATTGLAGLLQRATRRVAPSLVAGQAVSLPRLLKWEAGFGALTLVLAAMLTSISPPADATVADPEPLLLGGASLFYHGTLTIDPPPVLGGSSALQFIVATHEGQPVTENACGRTAPDSCVKAVIGLNGTGETHYLQPENGVWTTMNVLWSAPGPMEIRVTVTWEHPDDTMRFAFNVQAPPDAAQPNA